MIAPMRKVTVLSLALDQNETVAALRELGVLHVAMGPAPSAESASAGTSSELGATRRALGILSALHRLPDGERPSTQHVKVPSDPVKAIARTLELHTQQALFEEELEDLRFSRDDLAPFGDFSPAKLKALAERGVQISLFRLPTKAPFPTGDGVVLLSTRGEFRYGAAIGPLPTAAGLEVVPPPQLALSEIEARIGRGEAECRRIDSELHALTVTLPGLEERAALLAERHEFERVGESLSVSGRIVHLEGFCPAARVPDLESSARKHGWALWVREPAADDNVPVSLDLPRWLRPIAVLFKGLGILPGYREADVSAVFLLFFSLFFAMLVGDAGYGLLMLAAVLWARRKKPDASAQPFWLFGVFAVATIVWGVLTGSYFAMDTTTWPKLLQGMPWLKASNNIMWLCFLIGGAHLTVAHLWNAAVLFPSRKALAQIGWIGVIWLMFFVAGNLVVSQPMPPAVPWIGGISVLLIVLFMTDTKDFKEEWINHPMLILNLISCLVDVISYIRLFAVGMASAQIAMNFNQMAAGLPLPPWIKPLGMVLILVLGHGLNLVLSALSILVHAVRLNTLEFSNHKGLTWSGQPYTPFRKNDVRFNA